MNMKHVPVVLLCGCMLLLSGCAGAESHTLQPSESASQAAPQIEPSAQQTKTVDAYMDFFADMAVHELYVEISESDWQSILEDPERKEYCSVSVSIDGIELSNVGFRTKGSSSLRMALRRDSQRYPFRLKFDEYVDNQRFLGLDELSLANSNDDPSYLREYLGYEAYRQLGMNAPLVTFFNLYINGELYGLYIGVEAVDNRYLNRTFGEHDGNLYEADLQATLEEDMDMSLLEQKKGTDISKSDVSELIHTLDEMTLGEKGDIESILDVDSALRYLAASAVIHNWDDYSGQFAHNYYLYMHEGLLRVIPWDMNESFLQTQAYYQESDGARQDIVSPITGVVPPEARPLTHKLLAVPEYYEYYLSYCDTLCSWLYALQEELPALRSVILESVRSDPTAFFSLEEFERQFNSEYENGLAGFIRERAAYLTERLTELMK